MKKIFLIAVIAAICVFSYILFNNYLQSMSLPVDIKSSDYITVEIPAGSTTSSISEILVDHGLIRSSFVFKHLSKNKGYDGKYKAGVYMLGYSMSMDEIMDIIVKGTKSGNTVRFTIPEGEYIEQVAAILEGKGLVEKKAFLDVAENGDFEYEFLKGIPKGPNRLEGFLFPDTYEVYKDASEWDIINKMLARFDELFKDEYYERAEKLGFSVREIVTLASIIEREALVNKERPIVSSVFHNRLRIEMKLQSCATVQYALGEVKPVLYEKDLQVDSPYNTYIHKWLPPAPIASPGLVSIEAALYPATTDYLYFVAKGDGSHAFAVTHQEHVRNKNLYNN
ncbi:MAG: endolytic transglycosylase MltG [Clostridiales bacterium]|nr:endolytic transglycosylase MltG [Clostridiales bacterium]